METNEYTYVFDAIVNRRQSAVAVGSGQPSTTNTYAANALNQYTAISNQQSAISNPAYDADGNMLANGPWAYTWDAENRMASAVANGVLLVTNVYDHQSRRIHKEVCVRESPSFEFQVSSTHAFLYDGWNVLREKVAVGSGSTQSEVVKYYTWGLDLSGSMQGAGGVGGLLAVTDFTEDASTGESGATYFPCYDANGNVTAYLNAQGVTVGAFEYDAFGNPVSEAVSPGLHLPHRFSTKYLDTETGMYDYGRRFYSLELMRFLNRDPIEERGGLNLYGFVGNDPANRWDYLGLAVPVSIYPPIAVPYFGTGEGYVGETHPDTEITAKCAGKKVSKCACNIEIKSIEYHPIITLDLMNPFYIYAEAHELRHISMATAVLQWAAKAQTQHRTCKYKRSVSDEACQRYAERHGNEIRGYIAQRMSKPQREFDRYMYAYGYEVHEVDEMERVYNLYVQPYLQEVLGGKAEDWSCDENEWEEL